MTKILMILASLTVMACNKPNSDCAEKPRTDVMCTAQYDPVCGCNNKTYSNSCEAEARNIKTYIKGECKK